MDYCLERKYKSIRIDIRLVLYSPMGIERRNESLILLCALVALVFSYFLFNFHYSFNRDTWHYAFTTYRIIQEQIRNGIFPFWNNYEGLGMPLIFKGGIDLIFTPLLLFLSAREHLAIVGFIYFLLGIYFFYLFVRYEGMDRGIALAGGIVWGTNGFFLWHLHELGIQSVCTYIPLVLLTVKKISLKSNAYLNWVLFVLLNALQLSYGKWDLYEYSLWTALLYALCIPNTKGNSRNSVKEIVLGKGKLVFLLICGCACAFILIAPLSFSYLKMILNSYRSNISLSVDYYQFKYVLQHLLPNTGRYDSRSYISLFVFAFALLSLCRPNRLKVFSLILVVVYIVLAYPFKLYEIIRLLPFHKGNINVIRTNVLFYFGLSVLFSFSLQEFTKDHRRKDIGILFMFIVGGLIFVLSYGRNHSLGQWNYLSILFCLIPLGAYGAWKYLRWRGIVVLTTIFLSYICIYTLLFSFMFNFQDMNDGNLQRLEQTFVKNIDSSFFLKLKGLTSGGPNSLGYRAIDDDLYHPAFLPLHFIETTNFYSQFAPKTLCEIAINVLGNKACYSCIEKNNLKQGTNIGAFYSLSSVRYLIFSKEHRQTLIERMDKTLGLVYRDDEADIFENKSYFDKIMFRRDYIIVGDYDEGIGYLRNNTEWFKKYFIINKSPDFGNLSVISDSSNISYEVRTSLPSYLEIDVSSDGETMMIVSNAYDEDWNLEMDGKKDRLYRVNALFQGLKIRAGKHRYVIYYLPRCLYLEILLSISTLILLLVFRKYRFPNGFY